MRLNQFSVFSARDRGAEKTAAPNRSGGALIGPVPRVGGSANKSSSGFDAGFDPKVENAKETFRSRMRNAPNRFKSRAKDYIRGAKANASSAYEKAKRLGGRAGSAAYGPANSAFKTLQAGGRRAVSDLDQLYRAGGRGGLLALSLAGIGGGLLAHGKPDKDVRGRITETNMKGPLNATLDDDRTEGIMDNVSDYLRRDIEPSMHTAAGMAGGGVAGGVGGGMLKNKLMRSLGEGATKAVKKTPIGAITGLLGAGAGAGYGILSGLSKTERKINEKYKQRGK